MEIKGPKTFGSTVDRKINLNRDLTTPFLDPSKEKNPPVGHYETSKKELERVHSKKPSALAHYLESSAIKQPDPPQMNVNFQSYKSSDRISSSPGPGTYDLNFREELRILDHKLSGRY